MLYYLYGVLSLYYMWFEDYIINKRFLFFNFGYIFWKFIELWLFIDKILKEFLYII